MSRIIDEIFYDVTDDWLTSDLPRVPFLPVNYVTKKGHSLLLRNADKSDASELQSLFVKASEIGRGYGVDELLSSQYFKRILLDNHVIPVELEGQGVIACMVIASNDHVYARSKNSGLFDAYAALKPEHFGKGIGNDLLRLSLGIARDLGYTGCLSDTIINNEQALSVFRREGMTIVGCIPNCVYMGEARFQDDVLAYSEMRESFLKDMYQDPGSRRIAKL